LVWRELSALPATRFFFNPVASTGNSPLCVTCEVEEDMTAVDVVSRQRGKQTIFQRHTAYQARLNGVDGLENSSL